MKDLLGMRCVVFHFTALLLTQTDGCWKRHQDNKAMSMLEEITQRMDRWDQDRAGIKETFAVVESGDPRASLTVHDRRGEPLVEDSAIRDDSDVPQFPSIFSIRERVMLEKVQSSSW